MLILVLILLGYWLVCFCVRSIVHDVLYHDWWYLREAILNDEFSRRPFLYDVRYFAMTPAAPYTSSTTTITEPVTIPQVAPTTM